MTGKIEDNVLANLSRSIHLNDRPSMLIDDQGSIVSFNQPFLTLSKYREDQIQGLRLADFLPGIDSVYTLNHKYTEHQQEEPFFLSWIDNDSLLHTDQTQLVFIPNQDRYPAFVILTLVGVTEPTPILEHLFSKQIFNNLHIGLILLDREAKIIRLTKAAATILGGEQETYLEQNIFQLLKHLPSEQQLINKNLFEGVSVRDQAMSWNNGQQKYELLIDSFPIFDEQRQLLGGYVFIKDMTNTRSLEDQIVRNDRLAIIGQIAAGTAHEIRNPLTSIKGFLQIIQSTLQEHNLYKEVEFTDVMLTEIDRINHLVGEFLLLSKARDIQYSKVSLQEIMNRLLPIVESEAFIHGIRVVHKHYDSLPNVLADPKLLKQVFLNICKNAMDAMDVQGTLTIYYELFSEEQMLAINFQDTGFGIPGYVLDKIFDPFFTTKDEGTGLGLSICQRIIHDMGGKIRVSSKGYGTTFHIYIPYIIE